MEKKFNIGAKIAMSYTDPLTDKTVSLQGELISANPHSKRIVLFQPTAKPECRFKEYFVPDEVIQEFFNK